MKSWGLVAGLLLAAGVQLSAAETRFEIAPAITAEINITAGSTPGWRPTAEQRSGAIGAVQTFLDALENERYEDAYALQSDANKRNATLVQFSQLAKDFRAKAGAVKFWRLYKLTWTKDSPQAPFPGTYAAVDLVGQFANIDRDCGYIVLYQPPSGGGFTVMRSENNFLDNATARQLGDKQSQAKMWAVLSRACPNYVAPTEAQ